MVIGVCLRRFCLNMSVVWDICCSELGQGTTGRLGECCTVNGMVFVTLLCCRLLRYMLTMMV